MKKREAYESFLAKVDLLSDMAPYERGKIADALKEEFFTAGYYIIREGDPGDNFYFLEEGAAYVTKILNPGEDPTTLKEFTPGDYFGELALLHGEPRSASVIAQTE